MSKSRSKQQVISTKAKYWSACAQFNFPGRHSAFTDVHTGHDIRAPRGARPHLRSVLSLRFSGLKSRPLLLLSSSPRDLDPKVEIMQDEAERSRSIHQEPLLIRLLKGVGESLQEVERGEELCDSKRLPNPAFLQSNSENFNCTSFTLLENIRTDCHHSSKSDISLLIPA